MPKTIYHLGPGLFFGLIFLKYLDFPTFILANVIVDLEPYFIAIFNLNFPDHGFVHSFLGGGLVALILTGIMFFTRNLLNPVMSCFKLDQMRSLSKILLGSFSGIYLHILFDGHSHQYMQPLFPLEGNPFYGSLGELGVQPLIIAGYLIPSGLLIYVIRLIIYYWRRKLRKIYLEPSRKFRGRGIGLISVAIFFIIKGFNDKIPWYKDLRMVFLIILIILLPIVIISVTIDIISIIEAIQKKKKLKKIKIENWSQYCVDCREKITLEEKNLIKCGLLNETRKLVL
ncbi:MAG: hypothetical protein ACFFE5_02560 [Candidatus Thorarchaeota archaeon]